MRAVVDFDSSSPILNWMGEVKDISNGQPCHSVRLHWICQSLSSDKCIKGCRT